MIELGNIFAFYIVILLGNIATINSYYNISYGLYEGTSNVKTINETATAVLDFLVERLGVEPRRLFWYGRSIGSGN